MITINRRVINEYFSEGAVDGNLLCLDSPFLDAVRSYIEHGGLSRNCIVPNMTKWRRMIKYASSGDEPYLLMSDIRIVPGQWSDAMQVLPNSKYKKYSFSVIFYDGSTKQDSPKLSHKVLKEVKPKDDILETFKKRLFMNGGYLCIALSRRNVDDEALPALFDNVQEFVQNAANKYGYIARQCALGVHVNKQIYVDFQIFIKSETPKQTKRRKRREREYGCNGFGVEQKYDGESDLSDLSEKSDDDDDDESELNQQTTTDDEEEDSQEIINKYKDNDDDDDD